MKKQTKNRIMKVCGITMFGSSVYFIGNYVGIRKMCHYIRTYVPVADAALIKEAENTTLFGIMTWRR